MCEGSPPLQTMRALGFFISYVMCFNKNPWIRLLVFDCMALLSGLHNKDVFDSVDAYHLKLAATGHP